MSLFDRAADAPNAEPLASRFRPRQLSEFLGQESLVGPDGPLRREIESDRLRSCILWGPPGCGKTTLARIVAEATGAAFVGMSAISAGVKEIRQAVDRARDTRSLDGRRTILFLDEIHRFNKAQQDALLPHVEDGTLVLIGATTENPSFEVNNALLSRTTVYVLEPLSEADLTALLHQALADAERGLGGLGASCDEEALAHLVAAADGDARVALNGLEAAVELAGVPPRIDLPVAVKATQQRALRYDRDGEEHYNLISALHKSVRDGDPDGALYWLARMLAAGEDPLYVARRLIRMAVEDIGLATPNALPLAVAARDAYHMLGSPEGDLALAECAVYLAVAPKSNSIEKGWLAARDDALRHGTLPVPLHLRNAPTSLMSNLGYGAGYRYAHDYDEALVAQQHLPDELLGRRYYEPTGRGGEAKIAERIDSWRRALAAREDAEGDERNRPVGRRSGGGDAA